MGNRKKEVHRGRFFVVILLLLALSCGGYVFFFKEKEDTGGISRALAARQTAVILASSDEIKGADRSFFPAVDREEWYVPYASCLYSRGIWQAEEIPASGKTMGESLTEQELSMMVERLLGAESGDETENGTNTGNGRGKGSVREEEWNGFLERMIAKYDTGGQVQEQELLLIGTPNQIGEAGAWEAYTDKGVFSFAGLSLASMTDRLIKAKTKGTELLYVEEVLSEEIVYRNVWLEKADEGSLSVRLYGVHRDFPVENAGEECNGAVADLTMKGGTVTKIDLKKETIRGKLFMVSDTELEIEGYGKVPRSEQFHVYRTYGGFAELSAADLAVGYDQAEYIVADGEICAALLAHPVAAENIRVLLTDHQIGSIFHETAVFTCNTDFTLFYGEDTEERHSAGEAVEVRRDDARLAAGRIKIVPDEGGKTGFTSFSRKYGEPWYEGTIELALNGEGILIINEVNLETYLCYVVPSEMPESYGLEALKAQAVCARSYACRQLAGSAYSSYGAHVDDSTTFQVYNNTETDDLTRQAVAETEGQVLTYGGSMITAYYYATSCGYGNDMQVWGGESGAYPYLQSIYMMDGTETGIPGGAGTPDLSSEEGFRSFLDNTEEGNLERRAPWYRWTTEISLEGLKEQADKFLSGYAKSHQELVLFRQPDGSFQKAGEGGGPDTVGTIQRVTVEERSKSGYVSKLLVEGSEGAFELLRSGTVRALLGNSSLVYTKGDGTTADGRAILPSASIYLEERKEGETLTGYRIHGGGYGHGVGMSQTAASSLAGLGKSYGEILSYFYPGTEVTGDYGK